MKDQHICYMELSFKIADESNLGGNYIDMIIKSTRNICRYREYAKTGDVSPASQAFAYWGKAERKNERKKQRNERTN